MRALTAVLILGLISMCAYAEHSPLLPRPQRVEYMPGNLSLKSLEIAVPPGTSPEDRFAASELTARILERTGISVPVGNKAGYKDITLHRGGGIDALPTPGEKTGPASREAYSLTITSDGVVVQAPSSAGIFYAIETIAQLIETNDDNAMLPFVRIEDWPTTPYRGTMIDMSEGPLATEAEVLRQLDFLALWKGNQYYFYNEDSIELNGYSLLNPQAQFSKAQIRHIIDYARERHIDVVPCLELYGHQHDLFRVEKFSALADFPHGGEFDPLKPEVQKLIADWSQQYLTLFTSNFVHIGFDETWEIARAAKVKGIGSTPARLFLKQLNTVAQPFIAQNKFVLAWGDIVVKFPGIADQIPRNVAIVPWWYEPDPDPHYTKWLAPLVANHVPLFVASGVNIWSEMTPDFDKSFRNIDTFLSAGKQAGTLGLINTVWTDNQEALRRMAWPGIAYGAIASWQVTPVEKSSFFAEYSQLLYPAKSAPEAAAGFRELSTAESIAQKIWGTDDMDAQWSSPFSPKNIANLRAHHEDLRRMRIDAEDAQAHFLAAVASEPHNESLNAYVFGSRVLDYAGMRSLYAIEISDLWDKQRKVNGSDAELWELLSGSFSRTHGRVGDLMDALSLLIPEYRTNWLAEYTPYRMETALLRWNMEQEFWWRSQVAVESFQQNRKKGTPLPPLHDVIGSYAPQ